MKPPSLEKDGTVLKFINGDKERYSPQNDQDFCKMLRLFVSKNNFKLIVVIETLSKAFSDSIEIAICVFILGCWCESIRRQVWAPARKNITGPNGHGPVDFAIDLLQTAKTVGVAEVKDEDFYKGIAQNAVQLESALSNRKRKQVRWREELSEPVTVVYKDENLQAKVEKVLGHMVIGRGAEAGLGL
ncbi:hypothetical protein RhiirB3_446143 [Rhizophagus irregularis]|nr:hypothetical protein RhiirB3_446143 [Rhizophagus irregularis]